MSLVFAPGHQWCWGAQSKGLGSTGGWCCCRPEVPARCWKWTQTHPRALPCPNLDGTLSSGRERSSSYWWCSILYTPRKNEKRQKGKCVREKIHFLGNCWRCVALRHFTHHAMIVWAPWNETINVIQSSRINVHCSEQLRFLVFSVYGSKIKHHVFIWHEAICLLKLKMWC